MRRIAVGRSRASTHRGERDDTDPPAPDRLGPRLGYVLLALSAVCLCAAAWLMHSPAAALIPAAGALAAAGWDAARG